MAAAVAGFSEILRGSPYASRESMPVIRSLVTANADRDTDRTEFADLFEKTAPLMGR